MPKGSAEHQCLIAFGFLRDVVFERFEFLYRVVVASSYLHTSYALQSSFPDYHISIVLEAISAWFQGLLFSLALLI